MYEFRMPALGADMEQGRLVAWHIKPGDQVKRGQIVADVETDKGTIAVEVWADGAVQSLVIPVGQSVPVGTVIALLADTNTVPQVAHNNSEQKASAPLISHRPRISPLAKRMAQERGIDLSQIQGSGPLGAIQRADLETVLASKPETSQAPTSIPPPSSLTTASIESAPAIRRAITAAMTRSKREIPHYYLQTEVPMVIALQKLSQINSQRPITARLLPLVPILKAVIDAVRVVPEMNGIYEQSTFHPSNTIHLGVAIALRQGGLVAPAILDAQQYDIGRLGEKLLDLIQRARSQKLRSSEVSESTITVTNLGDTGVDTVYGAIYPPQVALVGIGRIRERPWAEHGMVGAIPTVTLSLSADHRVSDGHRGSLFLRTIAEFLQSPDKLY